MPRKTLSAAAITVLLAAWSFQPAIADGGRPASPSTKPAARSGSVRTSKLFTPFLKVKSLVSRPKADSGSVTPVGHESAAPSAEREVKARTAAYNDEEVVDAPEDAVRSEPALLPGAVVPSPNPSFDPIPMRAGVGYAVVPGYPNLNAPLNPTPVPHVPYQVGSSIITNQAFYPQEMLYPHKYRAMYPPYYYKVRGHWVKTPWGVWSNDRWELQGTEVKVNYRSNYSLFSGFTPPHSKW